MSAQIATQLDYVRRQILKSPYAKYATSIEDATKVPVEYIVVALAAVVAALLFAGVGGSFITNVIGFVYPLLMSVKAVESKGTDDDTQWLTYWVVYSMFSLLDGFASFILYWIPFYYPLKLAFLLWCMLPQFKGSLVVYSTLIKPFYKKHEDKIDEAIKRADGVADAAKKTVVEAASN